MANPLFKVCPTFAGINQPHAEEISDFIKQRPIAEKFKAFVNGQANYQYTHGDRKGRPALCVMYKNKVYHLVPGLLQSQPQLVNHGDAGGFSAIFYAILHGDEDSGIIRTNELIRRGAELNISTFRARSLRVIEEIPAGATPLWIACERWAPYNRLVIFLLKQGARFNIVGGKIFPRLSPAGKDTLDSAKKEMQRQEEDFNRNQKKLQELLAKRTGLRPEDL